MMQYDITVQEGVVRYESGEGTEVFRIGLRIIITQHKSSTAAPRTLSDYVAGPALRWPQGGGA